MNNRCTFVLEWVKLWRQVYYWNKYSKDIPTSTYTNTRGSSSFLLPSSAVLPSWYWRCPFIIFLGRPPRTMSIAPLLLPALLFVLLAFGASCVGGNEDDGGGGSGAGFLCRSRGKYLSPEAFALETCALCYVYMPFSEFKHRHKWTPFIDGSTMTTHLRDRNRSTVSSSSSSSSLDDYALAVLLRRRRWTTCAGAEARAEAPHLHVVDSSWAAWELSRPYACISCGKWKLLYSRLNGKLAGTVIFHCKFISGFFVDDLQLLTARWAFFKIFTALLPWFSLALTTYFVFTSKSSFLTLNDPNSQMQKAQNNRKCVRRMPELQFFSLLCLLSGWKTYQAFKIT